MEIKVLENSTLLYKYFAESFYYPDENQVAQIQDLSLNIDESNRILFEEGIPDLQIEYSRLFVGPFKVAAPPYGSVYLEDGNKIYGDSTMDVISVYEGESLQVDLKEPPDHIAIELEFISYLIYKQIESYGEGNLELASSYFNKQLHFLNRHLAKWVDSFCDKVESESKCNFYKKLAKAVKNKVYNDLINVYSIN